MGIMSEDYRIVNLEEGMPYVEQAIKRLDYELHFCKRLNIETLKLIHGYGSSGTGGRLRVAVRRRLEELKKRGMVKLFVTGEEFTIFNQDTIALLDCCDALRDERDLNRFNNGVTYVLLNLKKSRISPLR
jgi:hypothetical protein